MIPPMIVPNAGAGHSDERRRRQEEEEMTGYRPEDLGGDWEFKILRSYTNAFKKPDVLRRVVEEEARAGWVLLEKFDNSRLRFKRPASARDHDHRLDFDPYRSSYGTPMNAVGVALVVLVALTVAGIVFTVAMR